MKKSLFVASILLITLLAISQGEFANGVLLFLLTGAVVGTPISIPFWAMMAIYCALIALIMTDVVDSIFNLHRSSRASSTRKQRMPRRRYSNSL